MLKHVSLIALFFFATFAWSQEMVQSATVSELKSKQLPSGQFTFSVPSKITSAEVAQSAEYYTHYFTVTHQPNNQKILINMKTNDSKSRHIIVRFFVSLGLMNIEVDGKLMSMEEYYQAYLK